MLLIACSVFFAGCQNTTDEQQQTLPADEIQSPLPNPEENAQEAVPPVEGGTLHLAMRTTQTLNPLLNEDATVDDILKLIYMPLVRLDETKKPSPSIAQNWMISEDGKTLHINLRQDIYWQDGSGLSADDVIFSLDTLILASPNAVYKGVLDYIASYQKTGDYSVDITFYQAISGNLYVLQFPIISQQYYGGEPVLTSPKNMQPMGTGYYRFVKFSPAKDMRLEKCASSFGKTAYINEIIINISADEDTDLFSFDQGVIDAYAVDVADMWRYDSANEKKLYEYTTNYFDFVGFNFNRSIFQDKNIRKAIAHALPREAILENVYLGHAKLTNTIVNPTYWFYNADAPQYPYDLEAANELLEVSNWYDTTGNGIRDRKTNELVENLKTSILVNEENQARKQIALRLAEELRTLGFAVTVDVQPYDVYVEKLQNKDFDMFVGGWQFSVVPDYGLILHSSQLERYNYIGYINGEMDNLLTTVKNTVKSDELLTAYKNLQNLASEELPYLPIAYRNSALFSAKRLNGDVKPLENNVYDNVNEWFLVDSE